MPKHPTILLHFETSYEKIVTLEEELNEIVQEYEVALDAIKPDHSKAITVEGINSSETGYLFGDDAEIPFDSLQAKMDCSKLLSFRKRFCNDKKNVLGNSV